MVENTKLELTVGLFQDAEGAKDYFQRRLTYVTTQIEKIQTIGSEWQRMKEGINSSYFFSFFKNLISEKNDT